MYVEEKYILKTVSKYGIYLIVFVALFIFILIINYNYIVKMIYGIIVEFLTEINIYDQKWN